MQSPTLPPRASESPEAEAAARSYLEFGQHPIRLLHPHSNIQNSVLKSSHCEGTVTVREVITSRTEGFFLKSKIQRRGRGQNLLSNYIEQFKQKTKIF